jgi:hypothetical protein
MPQRERGDVTMAETIELRGRELYEAHKDRLPAAKTGPLEIIAVVVTAVMILGPLAAGALFWPIQQVQP